MRRRWASASYKTFTERQDIRAMYHERCELGHTSFTDALVLLLMISGREVDAQVDCVLAVLPRGANSSRHATMLIETISPDH